MLHNQCMCKVNHTLTSLDLGNNRIGIDGAVVIGDALKASCAMAAVAA